MQQQQQSGPKKVMLPRGIRLLAAAGLASSAALIFLCVVVSGPSNDAASRNLRDERELADFASPIDRVSKVLSHAFKPRLGPQKGKDIGGPWLHKTLGTDDPIERPNLLGGDDDTGFMAGEEPEVEPLTPSTTATDHANKRPDSVLHLGGAPRTPTTALRQAPGHHRNLQSASAPATFGVKKVVPVEGVQGGGKADAGDKSMLKAHKHGHNQVHKKQAGLQKQAQGHKKNLHGHKTKKATVHGHKKATSHKHKHPIKQMAAQAHKTKKAAMHAMGKAALKGKVQKAKIQKQIQKKEAQALANAKHAAIKTAKTVHHIKHGHGVKAKPLGHGKDDNTLGHKHGHKKTLHGHKKDGHLHLRALQQQAQAAQAAVAERLNLSPEDVAALRAIARDAALEVIKDAAYDAGFDLDFALPAGDDASKDEEAVEGEGGLLLAMLEDEEMEEDDMALFEPLDLGLEDVLDALSPAPAGFLDRAQVVNETTTTTTVTNTTQAAKDEADDDTGMLMSMLRQMNLTSNESDRLRTRARSAAESALRDAAAEAGFSGSNLETIINSFAAASTDAPPPATRRQLWGHNGLEGHSALVADDRDQRDKNDYYGASDDGEADAAWWEGFYDADEAVPRSGYSDFRDGTVGSRGRGSYYGNRQLHWHHNNNDVGRVEDVGPWDRWADREEAAGYYYFVEDDDIDEFFE